MRMEEYLEILTGQIRCRLAHDPIREELRHHMEDQKEAYLEEGMDEEEAEETAVLDMGDPVRTGEEFDRLHRPKMPWRMIGLIMLVSLTGLMLQYLVIGPESDYVDFRKQFFLLLLGFAVMMTVCFVDYSRIVSRAISIYLWMNLLINFFGDTWGVKVNGSTKWIYIAKLGLSIEQPVLALLFIPLYAAMLCEIRGQGYAGLLKTTLLMMLGALQVLRIPSTATLFILFAAFTFLLNLTVAKGWFKVAKKRLLAVYWGAAAAVTGWILYNVVNAPHQQTRFHRLFGLGEGILPTTTLLRKMLRGARWMGEGIVQGDGDLSYADYMLAYIISRYGIGIGIAVTGAILFLILLLFRKALAQKNESGMLIGVSCAMVFLAQVLLYLLSNLGIVAAAGYCPFLSYGGTGMIVTFGMLGLMLGVFRYENVMILYKKKSPQDYRMERKNAQPEANQTWWQRNNEQIRILLIVFVVFVVLMQETI